ncbi:hypothetical protein [Aeromonas salmonicida]|jgi:uncharacterized Fe-S cluster-containing MiaB family protein|uniref:hypothetical protein n=1 Tax=Aeromonas salmonicida TaxID=645 RepID=UPI000B3FE3E4|nr:hypothetical protein [Aeromonas salmonicida]ARW85368.1 hypothetical protein O23A_P3p0069 [Aeromonas salmonicida]
MSKALEIANEVIAEISAIISDELVKACGYESVKDMMIDAILNKTVSGKCFVHIFIAKFGSPEAALAAITANG